MMTEKHREPEPKLARGLTTRRGMMAGNIKAIGAIAASAVVANLLAPVKASAHPVACFLKGTKIRTVLGERRVEDLTIGDLLPTMFGGARPVQWIARYYRRKREDSSIPWAKQAQPVRILRSALAPNVPHADLFLTPGHALFIDDVLIPAGSLINGTTIALYAADELGELEFFQIKLETHDVSYAEGMPCETLLNVDGAASNFAEYFRKYGTPATRDTHCAPVVCNGARSEIKSRVRSVMSPWLGPQKIDVIRERLEERAMIVG
jgi:hypothetical protein